MRNGRVLAAVAQRWPSTIMPALVYKMPIRV